MPHARVRRVRARQRQLPHAPQVSPRLALPRGPRGRRSPRGSKPQSLSTKSMARKAANDEARFEESLLPSLLCPGLVLFRCPAGRQRGPGTRCIHVHARTCAHVHTCMCMHTHAHMHTHGPLRVYLLVRLSTDRPRVGETGGVCAGDS